MIQTFRRALQVVAMALLVIAPACNESIVVTAPPRQSNLTISNASPASGNAKLTRVGFLETSTPGAPVELRLDEKIGDMLHQVFVSWDSATLEVLSVEHRWGPPLGAVAVAGCPLYSAPTCVPTAVVDLANHDVAFTDSTMSDGSTLNGTIVW